MFVENLYVFSEYERKQKYENHVSVFLIAGRSQHCHASWAWLIAVAAAAAAAAVRTHQVHMAVNVADRLVEHRAGLP